MWYQHMGMGIAGLGWSFGPLLAALAIWSIVWKGMALWRAGRLGQKGWFVALLIINTVGILEIIYLYIITRHHESAQNSATQVPPPTGV